MSRLSIFKGNVDKITVDKTTTGTEHKINGSFPIYSLIYSPVIVVFVWVLKSRIEKALFLYGVKFRKTWYTIQSQSYRKLLNINDRFLNYGQFISK